MYYVPLFPHKSAQFQFFWNSTFSPCVVKCQGLITGTQILELNSIEWIDGPNLIF